MTEWWHIVVLFLTSNLITGIAVKIIDVRSNKKKNDAERKKLETDTRTALINNEINVDSYWKAEVKDLRVEIKCLSEKLDKKDEDCDKKLQAMQEQIDKLNGKN